MTLASPPPAMDATALKVEAARAALGHVDDGMRLGIGTGTTAEAFVRAAGRARRGRAEGDRRADLGAHRGALPEARRAAVVARRDAGARPHHRRRRRGRCRAVADQGRRRRAAARKDRRGCLAAHDRHCRPLQAGGDARPLSRCRSRSTASASRPPSWRSAVRRRARPCRPARCCGCATARLSSQMAAI